MMHRLSWWIGVFVGAAFFRLVWWLLMKYVIKRKPPDEPVVKPEPVCECGHTRDEHSPCSPMGCTKCECWRTPTWIHHA